MVRGPENASTAHITVNYEEARDVAMTLSEQFTDIRNTYGAGNILVHLLKPGETEASFDTATTHVFYGRSGFAFCQADGHVTDHEDTAACSSKVMSDLKQQVDKELQQMPELGDALAELEQASGMEM